MKNEVWQDGLKLCLACLKFPCPTRSLKPLTVSFHSYSGVSPLIFISFVLLPFILTIFLVFFDLPVSFLTMDEGPPPAALTMDRVRREARASTLKVSNVARGLRGGMVG